MMRGIVFVLFFPLLFWGGTNEGSIMLVNDSPFILTATILANDGTYLGQFSIQPGQQKNFTQNLTATTYSHPGTPDVSLTPYTVIWQCPSEEQYSMCSNVSPGSFCQAKQCPGSHFCKPKQELKKTAPSSTLQKVK